MYRVNILLYDQEDRFFSIEGELLPLLRKAGIDANFASQSLRELKMDPEQVAAFVSDNPSDAWVVCAASTSVLKWFSMQSFPTMAMFGGIGGLPIAAIGPDHTESLKECIQHLIQLGHRRIVMFSREDRRKPKPWLMEQILLDALQPYGLSSDLYPLPDWEESLTGFRACFESLFRQAPPTAIIVQETPLMMAAMQFLKERGIGTPEQVSLFCMDYTPDFEWCDPQPAHSRWDPKKVLQRITDWAINASNGQEDLRQNIFDSDFVKGSSIGPPPSDDWYERTRGKVW